MPGTTRLRAWRIATCALLAAALGFGQDVVFHKSKLLTRDAKVDLIFSAQDKVLTIREHGTTMQRVPYDAIERVAYSSTQRHRFREAGGIMSLNKGGPPILLLVTVPITTCVAIPTMFTKETKHQLHVHYTESGVEQTMALRLHKSEYREILATIRTQTGKRVQAPR